MNFSEFKAADYNVWHGKAMTGLKGNSFEETLQWLLNNDLKLDAYADHYLATTDELIAIQAFQKKLIKYKFVEYGGSNPKANTKIVLSNDKLSDDDIILQVLEYVLKVNDFLKRKNEADTEGEIMVEVMLNSNYLLTVAKLRALRFLITRLSALHESSLSMTIKGKTNDKQYESLNEHINIARATTMAMAGVVGGCDYIEIVPFDRKQNEFSGRIAQNTLRILDEEAYLNEVGDPSAGSYFIENLTYVLINSAWDKFVAESRKV